MSRTAVVSPPKPNGDLSPQRRPAAPSPHLGASRVRRAILWLSPALSAAVAALLLRYPPETHSFYPACPIYQSTGLLCPGCGGTRAAAALLHGHLLAAWHSNALTATLLPIAACALAYSYLRLLRRHSLDHACPTPPRALTWALLGVTLLFTLIRNLP